METSELFGISGLSAWYGTADPVIEDVALSIARGEVVGVIGMNGAGKTTLFKAIAGVLGTCRYEEARLDGRRVGLTDRAVKRRRIMVFSDERAFGNFTFLEYLSFVFRAYRTPLADCSRIVQGFGFERYVETPLRELSLGSRKKASLIAAFALSPDLLILDEPVNGLDFESTEYLYRLIRGYREHGSVLFSSHVLESVCLTCDRVLVLERTDGAGRIRKTFSGEEISPASIRSVLGHDEL
ncbi:ABC transporter ATP-binding protein [Collinsella sp. An271]|uniref:ATP-binding cassette domain-containing protein n=1 Tax=Collinsella sp. An271 TaxID=1965616 RepID=UPI000B37374F|nr:ABC transporter ATP-binding protein [Collinsella sp. An271]OUO62180.1 ABC transporter ATP-binding protein [Collinsella sp. An271]